MSAGEIIAKGREAWARLNASRSWDNWLAVGHALDEGRNWAMCEAHINQPRGRAFNDMMGKWLRQYSFDEIEKAARSQILRCVDDEAAIEAWRADLPLAVRLKLNHPANVLARWQASKARPKANKSPTATELKAEIARLRQWNQHLKAGAGNTFMPDDTPEALRAKISKHAFR
jgi:hypothetical protein